MELFENSRLSIKCYKNGITYRSAYEIPLKRIFRIGPFHFYSILVSRNKKKRIGKPTEKLLNFLLKYVKIVREDEEFFMCHSLQDDSYVGTPIDVYKLIKMKGIKEFYRANEKDKVASVGFNPDKKIWYGWSHRAIYGFRVGDKIKYNPDLVILHSGYVDGCVGEAVEKEKKDIEKVKKMFKNGILEIKNLEEAKFLAVRFANSVS